MPSAERALDRQPASERLDPVHQPAPSRRSRDVRTATPSSRARPGGASVPPGRDPRSGRVGVLDDVRQCLAGDEIRRRLDGRRQPLLGDSSDDGWLPRFARDSSAAARPCSVRIAGWTPRASSRSSCIAAWSSSTAAPRDGSSSGSSGLEPCSFRTKLKRQGDKALLRAVVEIALDPAARRVGRSHDSGPGLLNLSQLGTSLRLQARVLEREARRRASRLEEPGASSRDGSCTIAANGSPSCSSRVNTRLESSAGRSTRIPEESTYVYLRAPRRELEPWVAEGVGQNILHPCRRCSLESGTRSPRWLARVAHARGQQAAQAAGR